MIRTLLFLLFAATPALSGPWMRDQGNGFASFATESPITPGSASYSSLYIEYGLRPRLTLGFDGGSDFTGSGSALLFARTPLWNGKHSRLSADLALGAEWYPGLQSPVIRPGLSWGRNYLLRDKSGWMALDTTWSWRPKDDTHRPKLEATLGLTVTARSKVMLQSTWEHANGTHSLSLTPTHVYRFGKNSFLTSAVVLHQSPRPSAFKFGVWYTF
ncbi:hypothetical protein NNA36_00080 [Shimia sp. CNT1-13L.2]|uniref:hypothetical protein n=1 Tax=Shimia sp. CNT1-13L.2 TaxID=2959663 RepID=UPI0020CF5619|nr:hypothetical protein [Shimia sp. CNT1-13L.2]MCP9480345.1 hypothetical protein [Shimia sp. CNT1-13L.2]